MKLKQIVCLFPLMIMMLFACHKTDSAIFVGKELSNLELGLSFPPIADEKQRAFTEEQLQALDVRMIRFAADWANREPVKGDYDWEPFDARMAWVEEHDLSVVLTIQSNGPDWVCDPLQQNERSCVYTDQDAFEAYVRNLLKRYPGQIDKIQFGNEWISGYWFTGDIEAFIDANNIVYDVTKEISPETEVVLGGFATGTLHAIAFCDGALDYIYLGDGTRSADRSLCELEEVQRGYERLHSVVEFAKYDLVDLHFYDNAEDWPIEYQILQGYFPQDTEFIVTEFGGPHLGQEEYTDHYQAVRLGLYIETLDEMGITEAYYFKLVQGGSANEYHMESGLFKQTLTGLKKKPSYEVFRSYSIAD